MAAMEELGGHGRGDLTLNALRNACRSSAYGVELQDIPPPTAGFTLLSGSPSAHFARVNAGATERHTYSVTPKVPAARPGRQHGLFADWDSLRRGALCGCRQIMTGL